MGGNSFCITENLGGERDTCSETRTHQRRGDAASTRAPARPRCSRSAASFGRGPCRRRAEMRKRSPSRPASAQSAAPHPPWHLSRDPILSPWQPSHPTASAPSRWSPPWVGVPSAPKPSPWAGRLSLKRLGGVGVKPAARRGRSRRAGRGGAGPVPGAPFRLSTQACGRDRNRPG